jgi:hypothetical protein
MMMRLIKAARRLRQRGKNQVRGFPAIFENVLTPASAAADEYELDENGDLPLTKSYIMMVDGKEVRNLPAKLFMSLGSTFHAALLGGILAHTISRE